MPAVAVAPSDTLEVAITEALACQRCAAFLPLGPRPVFRLSARVRILLVSQAPSTAAHRTNVPWNDASGERLRSWLMMDKALFYDSGLVGILPTGLCYPGRLPNGGDAPPRPECAPLWLDRFVRLLPDVRLTLLIGGYAQAHRLGRGKMTDRVKRFDEFGRGIMPLPHPSWRTAVWEKRNPWFAEETLPALRHAVAASLA